MRFRSMLGVFGLALVLVLASTAPATAQTLQAYNIERSIALNDILSTITPNLPASVLAALAGGALEIRETEVYNPQANTLTSTIFAVPTGSPIPTPPAELANLGTALVAQVTMTIDRIYVTTKPFMSVMFVGTDTQSTVTPYGTYQGAVSSISAAFTTATSATGTTSAAPATVTTVIEVVAGAIVIYSPTATVNTLTVTTPPPSGGGGGTTSAPTVVITPASQTVNEKEVSLNASQSTDPGGLALSFQWSVVGSANVSLLHGTSAIATAQLGDNGPNTYTFMVVVTDSAGNSAMATTVVNYVGH
jgi:K319-like protein